MTSIGTLWTSPDNFRGKYTKAAAAYAQLTLNVPNFVHHQDSNTPEFKAKFPYGKVPAFEDANGLTLFEGAPIARYVASLAPDSGLLGNSAGDAAIVDQWIHFAEVEVAARNINLVMVLKGIMSPYSESIQAFFMDRLLSALDLLETHLSSRTYLVGERITLADIVLSLVLTQTVATVLDTEHRKRYTNLMRHLETLAHHPRLESAYGPIQYIDKAIEYTPPAKATGVAAKSQVETKEDEEDKPNFPAEPKVKSPLDDLPKSTFNLEDWKRAYSNKETRGPDGAIEWFYERYDPTGYSIWRVDFKYNAELTQTFKSSNQIGGFFNRLEASRKYLFGSVGVLGESNDSIISGVFILRGTQIKGVVDVASDWESYEYTKLDLANEDDKRYFEAALAWDLELSGKKWVDGKNFK